MNTDGVLNDKDVQKYIRNTVGAWLGIDAKEAQTLPPMPDYLARTFLRLEEFHNPLRDDKNRWEYSFSENFHTGNLWQPEVDLWVENLKKEKYQTAKGQPKWPEDKEFAVCLTHDVDHVSTKASYQQLARLMNSSIRSCQPSSTSLLRRYVFPVLLFLRESLKKIKEKQHYVTELEKCVELEKRFNFVSTYFYTVYPKGKKTAYDCVYDLQDKIFWRGEKKKIGEAIKEMVSEGFEAGLHGSYFSALEKETFIDELESLSRGIDGEISSTRQHYLHWDIKTTPGIHSDTGIQCDSTLGFCRNIGFRSGTSSPYFMYDLKNKKPFKHLQVPLIIHDVSLFSGGALEFDVEMAKRVTKQILLEVKKTSGVLTVLFHPEYMSKPPHFEYYSWLLETISAEPAWVTTIGNLNKYWRDRLVALGY